MYVVELCVLINIYQKQIHTFPIYTGLLKCDHDPFWMIKYQRFLLVDPPMTMAKFCEEAAMGARFPGRPQNQKRLGG